MKRIQEDRKIDKKIRKISNKKIDVKESFIKN